MQISISNSIKGSIVGLGGGGGAGGAIATDFRSRVLADGGTYENNSCLVSFINSLNPYSGNLLLGLYPNAAAAYSLRLVNPDYTGDAIRVRRSSDNAEQDIGFVNGVLDTATLLTFCGVGDGFITTWYDQSGNVRDATQTTASKQPQIVSSGALITQNGKVACKFDGVNDGLDVGARLVSDNIWSSFNVFKTNTIATTGSSTQIIICQHTGAATVGRTIMGQVRNVTGSSGYATFFNDGTSRTGIHTATMTTNQTLFTSLAYSNNYHISINGSIEQVLTGIDYVPLNTNSFVGSYADGNSGLDGNIQELIFYATDKSANRVAIETNINSYYGIY